MSTLLVSIVCIGAVGLVCGLALALGARFLAVKEDPRIAQIQACLPGANCGGCGFAGCQAYAAAIVKGDAPFNRCTPGGVCAATGIAKVMGVSFDGEIEEFVAVVKCGGDDLSAVKKFAYNGITDCAAAAAVAGGDKGCPYGCLGYGSCVRVCPSHAIEIVKGIAKVHSELCIGCGACAQVCPRRVIELIPRSSRVHVFCKSQDNGATVRKYCSKGCIGCRLCLKNAAEGVIIVDGTLARVNHSIPFDGDAALEKCPTKCLRRD